MTDAPYYRTIPEVAEYLRVTVGAVEKWLQSGALECDYAGIERRITQAQIDSFVQKSTANRRGLIAARRARKAAA